VVPCACAPYKRAWLAHQDIDNTKKNDVAPQPGIRRTTQHRADEISVTGRVDDFIAEFNIERPASRMAPGLLFGRRAHATLSPSLLRAVTLDTDGRASAT
jgi:hypothetical protein